jgi:hypothetical protein
VSGRATTTGGSGKKIGGGRPMLTLIPTCPIEVHGLITLNTKRIEAKNSFFISTPP